MTAYAEAAINVGSVDFLGTLLVAAPMIGSNDILRQLTTPIIVPATLLDIRSNTLATDGDNRLTKLLENVTDGQWSPSEDIKWDQEPMLPTWISPKLYAAAVSQLYYGEIATIWTCQRLLAELTGARVRQFLRAQINDEERHAETYLGYLRKLGDVAPMDESLATALAGTMTWPGSYHGLIVAFRILLEGEALRLQQDLIKWFPYPLLSQINKKISRDEARHVAFGKILLQNEIMGLDVDERMSIYLWVKSIWGECSRAAIARFAMPGPVANAIAHHRLGRRWTRAVRTFEEIGLVTRQDVRQANRR